LINIELKIFIFIILFEQLMISSVIITGDAGGLNYIGSNLTDENKSPFKYCCGCTERDISRAESDLTPLRRTTV